MSRHVPVLLNEVINYLELKPGAKVIDGTLGDAGHSEAMLGKIGPKGKLLGIDADPESLLRAKQNLYRFDKQVIFIRDNFVNLEKIAQAEQFFPVDAILLDLGWSSPQFAERGRGFSFEGNEPLDMRYDAQRTANNEQLASHTAAEIVNEYTAGELESLFRKYGEEDLAREIAEAIADMRRLQPIETTQQLVNIILDVYRKKLNSTKEIPWIGGIHPATKVFQALRIEVNQELGVLKKVLPQAIELLGKGGRLGVITFHSLEDRIVKHFFQSLENKTVKIITKKPVGASDEEIENNPRARSAKLRIIEKI